MVASPVAFVDEGLGNSSYLIEIGDGQALVVDPSRHPAPYLREAERRRLEIAIAVETHLHADFVSGVRELGSLGAEVLAPAAGAHGFPVRPLQGGDQVDLGPFVLEAVATPGHTPEHLAYLLLEGETPLALFSGGSLLAGAVARTDLIDDDQTEDLARQLWRSLNERILTLPDDLPVYPTHGGGSFCSLSAGGERTTTIGRERRANPLLGASDEDEFLARLSATFGTYPPYFRRMREVNRAGPLIHGPAAPVMPQLTADDVRRLQRAGAWVIDVRPVDAYAAAHIPDSVSIALRPQFATWLGWVVPEDAPLVFVLDEQLDRAETIRQARNVGYETILGELAGGVRAWEAAGHEVWAIATATPDAALDDVVDVRQVAEFASGHLPHARNIELGSLSTAELPGGPIAVMCGHGERAMTAASLLSRAGHRDITAVLGGPQEWSRVHGPLLTGV